MEDKKRMTIALKVSIKKGHRLYCKCVECVFMRFILKVYQND